MQLLHHTVACITRHQPYTANPNNPNPASTSWSTPQHARIINLLLEEEALGRLGRTVALGLGELLALAVLLAVVLLGVAGVLAARGDLAGQALQVLEVEGDREGSAAADNQQDRLELVAGLKLRLGGRAVHG